jgi:predicted HNH restriction endonuclease
MKRGRKEQTEDQIRGLCLNCNKNLQKRGKSKLGFIRYVSLCSQCCKKKYGENHYSDKKSHICERCGFIPAHRCQLDVHHKDRNRSNNDISNLETLCANCHRLEHQKEYETGVWLKPIAS